MFSIVGTEFSSAPLLRGCETAMKFVLVQLRPRVGWGWRGGGRHQTNLSLAIYQLYMDICFTMIYKRYIVKLCMICILDENALESYCIATKLALGEIIALLI